MLLKEAVALISGAFTHQQKQARWADLGCGTGIFTYALAQLLAPGSSIYAVDKTNISLNKFPNPANVTIRQMQMDFTKDTGDIEALNGILMANALHYVRDTVSFIQLWQTRLKPDAPFVIVEYDTAQANPWVPFPLRFEALKTVFKATGYFNITKIGSMPSRFRNGDIYAALAAH